MNHSQLGKLEAISLIIIIILNHIVLNLPKTLLDQCGSSTSLNTIYITILVFIFSSIILKLWKPFKNSDILDISEFLGGKILKSIIGFLFILYFITISSALLRNFAEILKLVYFEKATVGFVVLVFLIAAIIANRFGFRTIIGTNLIVVPIILVNLLIAFFCVSTRFDINRIFPIFGYGINQTFFSGISNIFAFTGISCLYFLKPLLKNPDDFNKVTFLSIGISAFYLFLSVTTLLFSFADVLTINELSPIYLLIRGTDFGRFLQRPDALFILGWILSLMSYLSIVIFFSLHAFKKITKIQYAKPMIYCISAIIFIFALIPKNMVEIRFVQNTIFKYFTIILVFGISFFILLFAYIKHKKKNAKTPKEDLVKNEEKL